MALGEIFAVLHQPIIVNSLKVPRHLRTHSASDAPAAKKIPLCGPTRLGSADLESLQHRCFNPSMAK
jgi:hypothetical protein